MEFATSINMKWRHNHPLESADVLKHCDVSDKVAEKFKSLYASGHLPFSALETHKCDLYLEDDIHYKVKAADRFYGPDYGNSLLVNCSNRNLAKLQRVQDNLVRVVCNSNRSTSAGYF